MVTVLIRDSLRRMRSRFFGASHDEVDEELDYHIARQTELNVTAGMTQEEARRRALIAFGGIEKRREQCHEQKVAARMGTFLRDVGYALRGLRRAPGFAFAAILTFAVRIGATTGVFSVVDRILFRSLPYRDAGRLVSVGIVAPIEPQEFMLGYSYYEWQDHQTAFDILTSWTGIVNCDLTEQNALRLTCVCLRGRIHESSGCRRYSSPNAAPGCTRRSRHGIHPGR